MTYRTPANLTSIDKLFDYANEVSEGKFYILLPISLFFIIFLYLKGKSYHTADSLLAASFITTIINILLFFFGAISAYILFVGVVLIFASSIWAMFSKDSE